jgi:hypothetical protein
LDLEPPAPPGLLDERPPVPSLLPVYLAHATTHLYIGLFPAVLFMLRETFSASYATLGAVFTAAMLAAVAGLPTVCAVALALLADRLRRRSAPAGA